MSTQVQSSEFDPLVITDLRDIWLFIVRKVRLIGLVMLAIVFVTTTLAFTMPARYAGETIIMLDPRKTKVSDVESVVSGLLPDPFALHSEMDVIQSPAVINRVIDDLDLMTNADFNTRLKGAGLWDRMFGPKVDPESDREKEIEHEEVSGRIMRNLEVSNDGRSYSITIRYKDRDPEMAAKIANAIADQYLVDQLEVKLDTTQRVNNWLSKRMEGLRKEVNNAERAVEEYKIKNKLIGVGDETITQQQLSAVTPQLLSARAELSQAEARLNSVRGLSRESLESSSVVLTSGLIQKLKEQEAEVRRKEADMATRYGDRHPAMVNIKNERRSIHDKIREETDKIVAGLQNDYDVARRKVASFQQELTNLESKTGQGNQAMVTLRQLQREAETSRNLYEEFMNRFKQVSEQQDLQVADARIVSKAVVPLKPYFPNVPMFIVGGIVGGFLIGFVLAFMLEYLDRGFRTLALVERSFHVSGLGMVPAIATSKAKSPVEYVMQKPLSSYAEAFRSIRTALHFSNVDNPPKVIAVTSSLPSEGKTVFVSSLARVLAMAGNKVLLIDCDLRRSAVQHSLGLDKNKPTIADVLAHNVALKDAIQKDASGAHVIIAAGDTPNPQDLLGSKQMESLIAEMRQRYDIIILDTPPVLAVADMPVVAKYADTSLYLVKWATTPREVVAEGLKQALACNVKLSGVVLTQVNVDDMKKYGYSTYYGRYNSYYVN